MSYQQTASKAYARDSEEKYKKAVAAGIAIDNALVTEYGPEGKTKSHFMTSNWLKYFSYEALGADRIKLLYAKTKRA